MSSDTSTLRRRPFPVTAYLKLFRFPLVFTAIADSAAGYLIANPSILEPGVMILLALSSTGLYFFGMALNDIADREKDKLGAPNRVLPSGLLTLKSAKIAAYGALACSFLAILLALNDTPILQRIVAWALVVLCIVGYNLYIKKPPMMGLVRVFNLLLGVAAGRRLFDFNAQPWQYLILALPTFVYVSALTYVSTLEDAGPSRRKVIVGTGVMCFGALLAALADPARQMLIFYTPSSQMVGRALWAFLFSIVLGGVLLRRAAGVQDEKDIMLLVRDGVAGIILLDAALLASCEDFLSALMVSSLLVPAALSVAVFRRLA